MKKSIRLYIDDLRTPVDESFEIVRSFEEAVGFVGQNGAPDFISFDHDLGIDKTGNLLPSGYDFAKWLVESDINGTIKTDLSTLFGTKNTNISLIV